MPTLKSLLISSAIINKYGFYKLFRASHFLHNPENIFNHERNNRPNKQFNSYSLSNSIKQRRFINPPTRAKVRQTIAGIKIPRRQSTSIHAIPPAKKITMPVILFTLVYFYHDYSHFFHCPLVPVTVLPNIFSAPLRCPSHVYHK